MATKVVVDMPICGYKAVIRAEKCDSTVKIDIECDCEHVRTYNELIDEVTMEDLINITNTKIIGMAKVLTPSCLVPCGIMNAAGVEMGLISKSLALRMHELRIIFEE